MIKLKLAAAIAACFAGAALAAPEIVETVKTAPEPAPVVVAVAEPAAPAVVDANMVRDLNTPSKEAAPDAVKGCTKKNAQCVRDMYQAFMDANGWPVSGKDAKGKSYYFGTASVSFPKTNAAYGKSLAPPTTRRTSTPSTNSLARWFSKPRTSSPPPPLRIRAATPVRSPELRTTAANRSGRRSTTR